MICVTCGGQALLNEYPIPLCGECYESDAAIDYLSQILDAMRQEIKRLNEYE
jgi:hypothetical protein